MTMVKVEDLRPGMVLDLEGDKYATVCSDPPCDQDHTLPWEYEYGEVVLIERENIPPNYPMVVTFHNDEVVAFPADWKVQVVGNMGEGEFA